MGRRMERRLGSVASMGLTGQKGSPGKIFNDWTYLVLIKVKVLISSEEGNVEKGYQPHFPWVFSWFRVFFLISFSPGKNNAIFHGWPICFSFVSSPEQNFWCHILEHVSSFWIFLLVLCHHEIAFVSGELPAQQWRVCASPHLDPVTCASKGAPDTSKTGGVLSELGPKRDSMKWEVLVWWTSEKAFVLWALCHIAPLMMLGDHSA